MYILTSENVIFCILLRALYWAVSVGDVKVDQDFVGTLAADVMSEAIIRAVKGAESAYGFLTYSDLRIS